MLRNREDLFIGQFPGCLVFADKTVRENGDYKDLARVSHAGNKTYSVNPDSLPDWVKKIIDDQAEQKKMEWHGYVRREIGGRPGYFYEKMLDALPLTVFTDWVTTKRKGMTIEECCRELLPIYEKYC